MYSTGLTQQLQSATSDWLPKITQETFMNTAEECQQLRKLLQFHEYRYYVLNEPLISDYEYDQLYKLLQRSEEKNPSLITSDSPTQRVGSSLNSQFTTVSHLVPMLSLDNSYNADDLRDFEIEGVSIGDSALDFISKKILKDNQKDWFKNNFLSLT